MRTVLEILNLSADYFKRHGMKHPRRLAEELLSQALGIERVGLYLDFDRPLVEEELTLCRAWLQRCAQGEPLQYIQGWVDFFGCRIKVAPEVLIPRQETEILVDKIAKQLAQTPLEGKSLLDLCCGSGCIGIALKKRLPGLRVCLADISPDALAVAKENAVANGVVVEFSQGDLLQSIGSHAYDFVVCNPPYVSEQEYRMLDIEVREHEPRLALVAGIDGMEFYLRLAEELPRVLKSRGQVWLEIGAGQGAAVKKAFEGAYWKGRRVEKDWAGHDRFFSLEIE